MIRLPAAPLVAAGAAFAAGFWLAWTMQAGAISEEKARHQATVADYAQALARSQQEAQEIRRRLAIEKEEAVNERDAEIERLAALAERVPDVIRVRVPAACPSVPAGGAGETGPDGVPGGEAGGLLQPDPAGLDIGSLRRLAREADALNANYRALLRACR